MAKAGKKVSIFKRNKEKSDGKDETAAIKNRKARFLALKDEDDAMNSCSFVSVLSNSPPHDVPAYKKSFVGGGTDDSEAEITNIGDGASETTTITVTRNGKRVEYNLVETNL